MKATGPSLPPIEPKNWVLIVIVVITFMSGIWGATSSLGFATGACIGFWLSAGYISAFWLIKKGYVKELACCALAAGGLPLLLPAVLGPLLLIAAYFFPDRIFAKRVPLPTSPTIPEAEERPDLLDKIQEQLCDIDGTKCNVLAQFTRLKPKPTSEGLEYDICYSIWHCPKDFRYYLRQWEVDWDAGEPKPARFQFVLASEITKKAARKLLDLLSDCPNRMTCDPELCTCAIHSLDDAVFENLWKEGARDVDRLSTENSAITKQMEKLGTDYFKPHAGRKRKSKSP